MATESRRMNVNVVGVLGFFGFHGLVVIGVFKALWLVVCNMSSCVSIQLRCRLYLKWHSVSNEAVVYL